MNAPRRRARKLARALADDVCRCAKCIALDPRRAEVKARVIRRVQQAFATAVHIFADERGAVA